MADTLWTSSVTGYRRQGTRLVDMRAIVGASVTARAVLEPLKCCPADAPAEAIQAALGARDFDVAGVRDARSGPLLGFVRRSDLSGGRVRDHLCPLALSQILSGSTPLGELFTALRDEEYAFVLNARRIEGIVTRADLNKPPVRVYLFGLVSLLEMHLGYWVSATYRGSTWEAALTPKRVDAARQVFEDRKRRNDATTQLACLQFCDKRDLVISNAELREELGLGSKARAERFLKDAEELRNDLAHSQTTLAGHAAWPAVITLVEQMERLVHHSDERIEARTHGGTAIEPELW